MGAIAREFFRNSPVLDFPLIALAIFMLVFIAITVRALILQSAQVDAAARLPLEEPRRQESSHE
jgi:hypothetical protein